MPESDFNLTNVKKKMIGMVYEDGYLLGKQIAARIQESTFEIPDNQTMEIMLDKFVSYDFVASQKLLAKIISPKSYVIANLLCAGGGVMIGGTSILNFCKTKNPIAKICYGVSAFCRGSATVAGTITGLNGVCGLSYLAVGGDMLGGAFLWVGNKAKKAGDLLDGRKPFKFNPFRPKSVVRRPIPKQGLGFKGMSFVPSGHMYISFKGIMIVGGMVFTIYTYGKFILAVSCDITKKLSPKMDYSTLIYNSARFIID